jgi:hypothetical protein
LAAAPASSDSLHGADATEAPKRAHAASPLLLGDAGIKGADGSAPLKRRHTDNVGGTSAGSLPAVPVPVVPPSPQAPPASFSSQENSLAALQADYAEVQQRNAELEQTVAQLAQVGRVP